MTVERILEITESVAERGVTPRRLWNVGAYYGMLRMFEAYRAQPGYETAVFMSEDEALRWLLAAQPVNGGSPGER